MTIAIVLLTATVVFVLGTILRLAKIVRMPAHLRWDLYPIPKGPRERQHYGGSYFEESDWWTKPMETGHRDELVFMLKEVLLLRGVWEGFRALWFWSFLLHWGLYLYISATVCALLMAVLKGDAISGMLPFLYGVASVFGGLGSAALIVLRTGHPRLRPFTTRRTLFNLALLGSIFVTAALSLSVDAHGLPSLISSLVKLGKGIPIGYLPIAVYAHIGLVAFFLAYFPFTQMAHMFMKYFTWHGVRWDDRPSRFDPHFEKALSANLARRTSWAATHIAASGARPWAEVVARGERGDRE